MNMKQIIVKAIALLCVLSIANSAILTTYDPTLAPTGTSGTRTAIGAVTGLTIPANYDHTDQLKYFRVQTQGSDDVFQVVSYDPTVANTKSFTTPKSISKPHSQGWTVVTLSNDLTCAAIGKGAAGSTSEVRLVNFAASTVAASSVNIMTTPATIAAAAAIAAKVVVGTNCLSFIADMTATPSNAAPLIYHSTDGSTYAADKFDTTNAWSGALTFSDDMKIAVGNAGIWKFTTDTWARVSTVAFTGTVRKVYTSGTKIIVVHMATGATPAINVQFFNAGSSFTEGSAKIITDTVSGTPDIANPGTFISISQSFTKVIVYGKVSATGTAAFYKGVSIDWTPATPAVTTLDLSGSTYFSSTTASDWLEVSDTFIYARTATNHVGAFWNGVKIIESFTESIVGLDWKTANSQRSILVPYKSNNINVIHEDFTTGKIELYQTLKNALSTQLYQFDRTLSQLSAYSTTGSITLTTTSVSQTLNSFNWFTNGLKSDSSKRIFSAWYLDSKNTNVNIDIQLASTTSLKDSSNNGLCAVIADSAGSKIYVYNFAKPATGATAVLFADISSLTGTAYDVSDNCLGLRVDSKVYHWDTSANPKAYVLDTASDSTKFTASVPVFSNDFSVAVNEAGIWTWDMKVYTLNRAETFIGLGTGYTILVGKYLVIFRYKVSSTANVYDYNIQANYLVNSTYWTKAKDGEDTGKSTGIPKFDVSENNGKYVVYGLDGSNKVFQTIKNINYVGNSTKALTIPDAAAKALSLDISITETFVYARSLDSGTPKHYAWVIGTSALTESFNVAYPIVPTTWTYKRSLLVLDQTGKITVLNQFDSTLTIGSVATVYDSLLIKYQGKTAGQVTNPKTMTWDYTVSYGDLGTASSPAVTTQQYTTSYGGGASNIFQNVGENFWGRWIYMTTTDKKVGASIYVYSGAAAADKAKTVVLGTALSGAAVIRAVSFGGDCVLSTIGSPTSDVNLHTVDASGITLVDNAYAATQLSSVDITAANLASVTDTLFTVSTGCLAFRAQAVTATKYWHYVKSAPSAAAGAKYTKAAFLNSANVNVIFDPTFRFGLYSTGNGKIATLATANDNYADTAITNAGLASTNKRLWVSSDGKTLLYFSWNNPTTAAQTFYLRFFNLIGAAWAPADATAGTAGNLLLTDAAFDVPRVVYTPTMDVVAITYKKTSATAGSTTLIFKLTISAVGFSSYTLPTADFNTAITLAQQYVYFDETTPTYMQLISIAQVGNSQEIFYTVNKAAATLTQVSRRRVGPSDYPTSGSGYLFKGFKFIATDANTLNAFYQYDDATLDKAYVKKTMVFNATTVAYLATISVRQVGVCVIDKVATLCRTGCSYCTEPSICLGCYAGWVLESASNQCYRCDTSCSTCASSSAITSCASCYSGFYLQGTTCQKCPDSCGACLTSSAQSCSSCKLGYYLQTINTTTSSGACSPCIDNCNVCSSATTCNICVLGFVYNADLKVCVKCLAGCSGCDPKNITTCIGCASGYRTTTVSSTNSTITGCAKCSLNCTACTDTACTACRTGFRLTTAAPAKCVELCRLPCAACSQTDPTVCTACVGGYTLSGSKCTANVTCSASSACTTCPIGYTLASSKCVQCTAGDTCSSCIPTDPTICGSCVMGYYIGQGNKCITCNNGCIDCTNGITCSRCSAGYVLARPSGTSKCIKCDPSCATCYGGPRNCDTCGTGFTLTGWGCVSGNRLVSNWKFAVDFSKFTSTDLTNILTVIADKLGIAVGKIDITSLTSGSVNVGTGVAYSSPAQLVTMQSSLSSIGTNLGGYTVESVSSNVVADANNGQTLGGSGSSADAGYYKNIAIIVGIVIPIAIIILFIIIIILMKKGVICGNEGGSKIRDATMDQINVHQKESELGTMRKK